MAIQFRLCKNDATTWLRETFQATPLRVPEERVQPLMVIGQNDNKIQFRGDLKFLLEDPNALSIIPNEGVVSNVSLQRTKKVDISIGLNILDGFLQGLQLSPSVVGASFKGVSEISFSFTNVFRRWIDLGELGLQLKNNKLASEHPSLNIFRGNNPATFLIISDAIVSNSFSINLESGREDSFDLGIPAIQKYITDAKLKVKVSSSLQKNITFEGEKGLTFAFSCVRVVFDEITGAISLMEGVNPRSIKASDDSNKEPILAILDEDEYTPGLLSWD